MINSINMLMMVLMLIGGIMVVLLVILAYIYLRMKKKENEDKNEKIKSKNAAIDNANKATTKQYTIGSVFDFMEFDKIEDNMIIQKKGKRYLMVIECQGINYDLMSQDEKIAVEEGFIQFLNSLSKPVQLYVQTRKINLESSLQSYQEKVDEIESAYRKQKAKYEQLTKTPQISDAVLRREYYEYIKQKNLYEYGKDIIYNTERMSLNRNILSKKYYVVISYYPEDSGEANLDKEEIKENAFSELYTQAQAIIRALSISEVIGKILDSTQLADLLYIAYNRDDSDVLGVDKAIKAKYDELYTTAPDYMEEKLKLLDEEIEREAYRKANEKVIEAQTETERKYNEKVDNIDDIINNLATLIIEENTGSIGADVAEKAKEKIAKEGRNNVQEEKGARKVSGGTK